MSNFFTKRPLLTGAIAGGLAYGITLYTSPAIIYMANFVVGSALIGLLGPVAAACAGWIVPILGVLAAGALAAWLINSLVNMCFSQEQNNSNEHYHQNNNSNYRNNNNNNEEENPGFQPG